MQLIVEHSILWLLLIIPLSAWVGWLLYFHKRPYEDWNDRLRFLLAVLRFVVIAVVGFLLLEPFLISLVNDTEKPKLVVFDDLSLSIDSNDRGIARQIISNNLEELESKYQIDFLRFGGNASADQIDPFQTNYEAVVGEVNERYYNQNVGAVVVSTDGVQTIGADPRYLSFNSGTSLFALALGDSAAKPDMQLTEVLNNRLVYFGNEFEVRVRYKTVKLKGDEAEIKLLKGTEVVASQRVSIADNEQSSELVFKLKATQVGLNRYSVLATEFDQEPNKTNNSAQFFVDVLDNRTKVLIVAKSPHPDVAAIRLAIESNDQYEVSTALAEDWDMNLENIDLVILHGLPTDANDLNKVKGIRDKKVPVLSVLTKGVSLLHFERMNLGLNIVSNRKNTDEAGAWINGSFNLFNPPKNPDLNRFPPLSVIFGDYKVTGETYAALNQRVGSIETDKPLLIFSELEGWKRAVLTGEGWWKWRLFDRMRNNGTWADQIMIKSAQYLALKQKRTRLNITSPEKLEEGNEVAFDAEFYNESYELNNEADIRLTLTDSNNKEFDFRFQNNGRAFRLSLGTLAAGDYKWTAEAQLDGERFTQTGEFLVNENKAEFVHLRADYDLITQWTALNNGRMFHPQQSDSLIKALLNLETAKPVIHTTKEWTSLVEWKSLAFLILLLISIEWFLRKFNGYY
ncbi:MAG: hypothetical protein R2813_08515 [Flavobacteriales bacterium]